MILNEKEAKKRWCPFVRTLHVNVAFNRVSLSQLTAATLETEDGKYYRDLIAQTNCVASGCMCWRWFDAGSRLGFCGNGGPPCVE